MVTSFVDNLVSGRAEVFCAVQNGDPKEFAQNLRDYLQALGDEYQGLIITKAGTCRETHNPRFNISWCATDAEYEVAQMQDCARAQGAICEGLSHSHYDQTPSR